MLELIFVTLMQAAAGDPTDSAPSPAQESAAAAAPPQNDPTASAPQTASRLDVVHCRVEPVTASRVRVLRHCSTPRQDNERTEHDRRTMEDILEHSVAGLPNGG